MLLTFFRLLIWLSVALVPTTVSTAPIPELAWDGRGFDRLSYDPPALPEPSELWLGSRMPDVLEDRLRGVHAPALDTAMQHFCLPPFQRNPACIRCDALFTSAISDKDLSKVGGLFLTKSSIRYSSERY